MGPSEVELSLAGRGEVVDCRGSVELLLASSAAVVLPDAPPVEEVDDLAVAPAAVAGGRDAGC